MNNKERNRIVRLQKILDAVPFSASGTATTTGVGAVMFEQDMRALHPYIRKITEGMVLQGNEWMVEGEDYENPDRLLSNVEAWIEIRKSEGWQNADQYSLGRFMKKIAPPEEDE